MSCPHIPLEYCQTFKQRERVAMLNACGGNVYQAADLLGIRAQALYDIIVRLRRRGLLDTPVKCPVNTRLRAGDMTQGSLRSTLPRQDLRVRQWVSDNVPEDGTLMDLMWSVFADLAEEEGYFDDTNSEAA
jgi:hypothetical protein